MEYHAETVMTIMKPVSLTMILVILAVKLITIPGREQIGWTFQIFFKKQSGFEF